MLINNHWIELGIVSFGEKSQFTHIIIPNFIIGVEVQKVKVICYFFLSLSDDIGPPNCGDV